MSDLEDKLNSILSDSNTMSRIMALAHSLSDGQTSKQMEPTSSEISNISTADSGSSQLRGIDPKILGIAMKVMSAYNAEDNDRANLLAALRPFVRKERYAKLDQAIKISKITRAARTALDALGAGDGGASDV